MLLWDNRRRERVDGGCRRRSRSLSRIDLRGQQPVDGRPACRAAARRRRRRRGRPDGAAHRRRRHRTRRRRRPGVRRDRSTGCVRRRSACPRRRLAGRARGARPDVRAALEVAIDRTRAVHADQRRTDTTTTLAPGATVTERWVPVERVGLYVPGGNAVYPSSVVMNVVPAQTAGVDSLVIASPPQADFGGLPHPTILAAAALLGVDEVWAVGGAQAVALLAYGGTDTDGAELAPVDMITGPGNIYVTAAKRICRSQVGIDAEAGPDRDRDPRRSHRRSRARRRRPDQPGRARRDGGQRAGHDQRRAGRRHRRRGRRSAADHRAPRAGDRGADRTAVGDRARRRRRRGHSDGQRLRRRAPRDPDRRRLRRREPDPFCRCDLRRRVVAGQPR